MPTLSKPIENTDPAQAGQAFRETDAQFMVLTDAAGNFTGQTVLVPNSAARAFLAPGDLFSTTAAPTAQVPGTLNQRYWHTRTPTRVDLWKYEGLPGAWVLKIQGFVLDTSADALPTPLAGTFINFSDTQVGGSVQFVPPAGIPIAEFLWKFTPNGPYQAMPLDGIINVGNAAGAVYAYAPATATHAQVPVAASNNFTVYVAPTPGNTTPAAPTFTNFNDTAAGGSVTLVPASGVSMSLYLYKIGAGGTYATVPLDGIINVGNIDGQVFAYSQASGTLNQSLTGASPNFTSVAAPGNTTPDAPTFSGFDDTANTVTIVPATGVSMALVVYALPGSSTFVAAPQDGMLSVGNVAGVVQAKSLAGGSYNASGVGTSPAFTVTTPSLPTPPPPTYTAYDQPGRTATVAPPSGYSIAQLVYVLNGAAAVAVPGSGAIPVGNAAVAQNALVVYVAAAAGVNNEGQRAYNEVAFAAVAVAPTFAQTLNPGTADATLSYDASSQGQFKYNSPVQAVSTAPGNGTLIICYPNLQTPIAAAFFDPADAGKACGIVLGGTLHYQAQQVDGSGNLGALANLTFYDGTVLLS